jgi:hypothetical protein
MTNPLIPRATVHAWSEQIGDNAVQHTASLQRLLKDQRRLTRFIEENQAQMKGASAGISVYLTGVIARMFDLAGGRLRSATWDDVRAAEAKIKASLDRLLPIDDGFLDRFHALSDRAQAHILDEAAMALFVHENKREGEEEIDPIEGFKVLLVCWVVTEVLDANWHPPKSFQGESTYTYVHITPPERKPPADGGLTGLERTKPKGDKKKKATAAAAEEA